MIVALDTEFNSFGGELISLALVAEDGRSFYEVLPLPAVIHPWVAENVIPRLGKEPLPSRERFSWMLHEFLGGFDRPTIVCDWHADVQHFCAALAGADYASSLDFGCSIDLMSGSHAITPANPHNALSDAEALLAYVTKKAA